MYVVSGATGNTGSVVAKTLLEKGLPVRVIVRSRGESAAFGELGAEIAVADLHDADALTEALQGGKVLYLMNPPSYQSEDRFVELEKVIGAFQTAIKNSALKKNRRAFIYRRTTFERNGKYFDGLQTRTGVWKSGNSRNFRSCRKFYGKLERCFGNGENKRRFAEFFSAA